MGEKLDVYAVARLLNVRRRTVYYWASRGLIPPGERIGGVRRWDKAELAAAIKKCPA